MTAPVWVRLSSVFTARAMPKSVTLTSPSGVIRTLPGLTSRWTTPCRCAKASAEATPAPIVAIWRGGMRLGVAQDGGEGPALDVLHDDEVRPVVLAPVEDRDDVGVGEVGGGLGLAAETLDEGAVDGELGEEHLERDRSLELAVHGPVDLGHAAAGDQVGQLVATRVDPRRVDRFHGALSLRWEPSPTRYGRVRHGAAVVVVTGTVVVVTGTVVVVVVGAGAGSCDAPSGAGRGRRGRRGGGGRDS